MNLMRLKHTLTAHHLRYSRRSPNVLGICHCGWRSRLFRPSLNIRIRRAICLILTHQWDGAGYEQEVHVGRVGFEESEETCIGRFRQCQRCYKCEFGS